jgi:hypothetical protein
MLGTMSGVVTRRVRETYEPYRLPDRHELVAGLQVLMVDVTHRDASAYVWGTTIQLDDNPVRLRNGEEYVYYHCVRPSWDGDCFVPLLTFTGEYIWPVNDTFVQTRFWIPIR